MTGPTAVLVEPSSATSARSWESGPANSCAINRTHSELVKFEPHDSDYDLVLRYLKKLAQRSSMCRRPEIVGVENFRALHEKDLDQEFKGRSFWYRETLEDHGYPKTVKVDSHIRLRNQTRPVTNEVITLRRVVNLQIRGHAKRIVPGSYQSVWIFWFFDGETTATTQSESQSGNCNDPSVNTINQRYFAPEPDAQNSWVQDCRCFQPWNLRCSVGQAREPRNFLVQNVDVDRHKHIPPALMREGYAETVIDSGLWNTLRNTGWCEVQGPNVEVGADGEAFFLISKDFERRWLGGFSFGGIKLEPC